MERRISLSHLFAVFLFFACTAYLEFIYQSSPPKTYLVPPPRYIERFGFGFNDTIADSLWLRWIQDADTCQVYKGAAPENPVMPSTGEYHNPRYKFCDNSWSFKMLDAVTLLAPKYRMVYLAGALSLSVLVEDYEGAKVIFDRGVEAFPNDWMILYRASYHYLYDRQDYLEAAKLMERAAAAGAPNWLTLSAARLYSKSGRAEYAIQVLEQFKKSQTKEIVIKDIERRISELRKQLQ